MGKKVTVGDIIFWDRYASKHLLRGGEAADSIVLLYDGEGQPTPAVLERVGEAHVDARVLETGEAVRWERDRVWVVEEVEWDQLVDRISRAVASVELPILRDGIAATYKEMIASRRFVPGGRILNGAGKRNRSLYNCFVLPMPEDSREGIIRQLDEQTALMSKGGGVGFNVSSLRPRGCPVRKVDGTSSGAVSWADLYSDATGLVRSAGSRRGALMLILEDWHPDILEFIQAKTDYSRLTNANLSVGVSDAFMKAVEEDDIWELVFPDIHHPAYAYLWDGDIRRWRAAGFPVRVYKRLPARDVWMAIVEASWRSAEPGLWFVDRSNLRSNTRYYNRLVSTNPCGEQPLPPYGACNLGSLNLATFCSGGEFQWDLFRKSVRTAVRFLDSVVGLDGYMLPQNHKQQLEERRVGLGTIGFAEALIRLRLRYGSPASLRFVDRLYSVMAEEAYLASSLLAREKGVFPRYSADGYLSSADLLDQLPSAVRESVKRNGVRNATLLTQPPTGTTGTMVGTSTGIEPFFAWEWTRFSKAGTFVERVAVRAELSVPDSELPEWFVTAQELTPEEHVRVQAAVQRWMDSAVSKTANMPSTATVEDVASLYQLMYTSGCKGGTVFRDGSRGGEQVLKLREEAGTEEEGVSCNFGVCEVCG